MNEYTLSEFRANLREAFNAAEKGEPVIVERYGVDYFLIEKSNYDATLEKNKSDSQSEQKGEQQ